MKPSGAIVPFSEPWPRRAIIPRLSRGIGSVQPKMLCSSEREVCGGTHLAASISHPYRWQFGKMQGA